MAERDRTVSVSLQNVDIKAVRENLGQSGGRVGMGMFAGPPQAMGVMAAGGGGGGSHMISKARKEGDGGGSGGGMISQMRDKQNDAACVERDFGGPAPVPAASALPTRFSRDIYPEEELEGKAFLDTVKTKMIPLTVYVVKAQLRKKVRLPVNITAREASRRIVESAHLSDDDSLLIYSPSYGIFLDPNRKLWSYALADNEQVELKPFKKSDGRVKKVVVTVQISGSDECQEEMNYLPETTAAGIMRAVRRKICDRMSSYGIYVASTGQLLPPKTTLSSCRLVDGAEVQFKPLSSSDTKRKQVILKIMLVESSRSKMMKFDSSSRVSDAIKRVCRAPGSPDPDSMAFFAANGSPLNEDATLDECALADRDVLELKKKTAEMLAAEAQRSSAAEHSAMEGGEEYEELIQPSLKSSSAISEGLGEVPDVSVVEAPPHCAEEESAAASEAELPPLMQNLQRKLSTANETESSGPVDEESTMAGDPTGWSALEVNFWLSTNGFDGLVDTFFKHGIDGKRLVALQIDSLKEELGIKPLGPRKKLFSAIQQLCADAGLSSAVEQSNVAQSVVEKEVAAESVQEEVEAEGVKKGSEVLPTERPALVRDWSCAHVSSWLVEFGHEHVREAFESHDIDGKALLKLDLDALKNELGISALGARKKVWARMKLLFSEQPVDDDGGSASTAEETASEESSETSDKATAPAEQKDAPAPASDGRASDPLSWSIADVQEWLVENDFSAMMAAFEQGAVDGPTLLTLDGDSLKSVLGIKALGPRKKLGLAIEALRSASSSETSAEGALPASSPAPTTSEAAPASSSSGTEEKRTSRRRPPPQPSSAAAASAAASPVVASGPSATIESGGGHSPSTSRRGGLAVPGGRGAIARGRGAVAARSPRGRGRRGRGRGRGGAPVRVDSTNAVLGAGGSVAPAPVAEKDAVVATQEPAQSNKPVAEWAASEARQWMQDNGVGDVCDILGQITGAELLRLDSDTLKARGVKALGLRKRVVAAVEGLKAESGGSGGSATEGTGGGSAGWTLDLKLVDRFIGNLIDRCVWNIPGAFTEGFLEGERELLINAMLDSTGRLTAADCQVVAGGLLLYLSQSNPPLLSSSMLGALLDAYDNARNNLSEALLEIPADVRETLIRLAYLGKRIEEWQDLNMYTAELLGTTLAPAIARAKEDQPRAAKLLQLFIQEYDTYSNAPRSGRSAVL